MFPLEFIYSLSHCDFCVTHGPENVSLTFKKQLDIAPLKHNTSNLIFIASTNRNMELAPK